MSCAGRRTSWPRSPPSRSPSSRSSSSTRPTCTRAVESAVRDEVAEALKIAGKAEREEALDRIKDKAHEQLGAQFEGREKEISAAFRSVTKKEVRARVLRDQVRIDGRGPRDIRPLTAEVGVLPAGARLGAVRARRDPDPGRHHAEHAAHGAGAGHARRRRSPSATCTTTTSRRTRPVRPAGSARRSGARSGTARWPSGP